MARSPTPAFRSPLSGGLPSTDAGAHPHHRVPQIVAYLRLPLLGSIPYRLQRSPRSRDEEELHGFIAGERSRTKSVGTKSGRVVPSQGLSLRHLSDISQAGCSWYTRTLRRPAPLPGAFMPVLRHLPRQATRFSWHQRLPVSSRGMLGQRAPEWRPEC